MAVGLQGDSSLQVEISDAVSERSGDIAPGAGVWFWWLPKEASGDRAAWLTWWADANRAFEPGFSTWLLPPGPLRKRAFHLISAFSQGPKCLPS